MIHRRTSGESASYNPPAAVGATADLVCFSHLRWDFVFQRPQHLMTRFARRRRVLFVEEPLPCAGEAFVEVLQRGGVTVARARMPEGLEPAAAESTLAELIVRFVADWVRGRWIAWYYTPMALAFTAPLKPSLTVYDCMDELSAFRGAPPALLERESQLLAAAHVVFTGGPSLYEAKKRRHPFVLAFPSSIDASHFMPARGAIEQPADQQAIPSPRLGFFGVLDERFDAELLGEIAAQRPDWQFVMIGPVVKIDPSALPRLENIHYLGQRAYEELPGYLAGWDVALMPFAMNESTRFISPTKTPEYLAAGRAVVSTPIADVVRVYGDRDLVHIAATASEFILAIEHELTSTSAFARSRWLAQVDATLAGMSWDRTWLAMEEAMELAADRVGRRTEATTAQRIISRAAAGAADLDAVANV